ncbi:MAG: magnesium transporter [Candidatus Eisenbacteria bacterium]|uniref:Magnesium transporter MgtE n=1 Tax=Eiseniibacteriota bacterium TaxID=2212470 RepID=A0A956SFE0_UNCEI|nr:magnesium transporter [Candidatus Eisenbacteria bacterium]
MDELRAWSDDELRELIEREATDELESALDDLGPTGVSRLLAELDEDERQHLWALLPPEEAADHLEAIPWAQASDAFQELPPDVAAKILDEFRSDDQADFISELDDDEREAVLREMDSEDATEVRKLALYEDDVAGGLMETEFLAYDRNLTVAELVADMRGRAEELVHYDVQYTYVTENGGVLVGVLRLRDLVVTPSQRRLESIMIDAPLKTLDTTSLEDLEHLFDSVSFLAIPVVDAEGRIVGVVRRHDVEQAAGERSEGDYLKSQGIVGGEELRSMPTFRRARRRLSWLTVNIGLNVLAASVIAAHQDTISAVIALAVFLPILSDMSGCTGNQAVAVSMRELALGLARPSDAFRVWRQELSVGAINGLVLGGLLCGAAYIWKGNVWLGLVVGLAMLLNTLIAVSIGGVVPLVLKKLKFDPALASGPILTTVTDMCGFFLMLTLAGAVLGRLG